MKKYLKTTILIFIGVFYAVTLFSQQNYIGDDIAEERNEKYFSGYAPYGEVFTPDGTLKVLIIYAGFDCNEGEQYIKDWSSGNKSCPDYVDATTGKAPRFMFSDISDFETVIEEVPENISISRFYNDMSYGKFKMIGDVFKDPEGKPTRINIDPTGAKSWSTCNKRVLEAIDNQYPDYDWDSYFSQYDNRENKPNFQFDNTDIVNHPPDNELDYVIIFWRWSRTWNDQPVEGIKGWLGSGGGFSTLGASHTFDSYTIKTGYTHTVGDRPHTTNLSIFVHEVAHELYSCPHVMGCNSCAGKKFHLQSGGLGMMSYHRYMFTANAWESWLCGWLDITSNEENTDLQSKSDLNTDGIYTIGDFLTTGDVIRIKIPNTTDQYLWIENHQKLGVWEFDPSKGLSPSQHGEEIPDSEPGIYMYIERVHSDINNISTGLVRNTQYVGGMKVLNAQGNYDYTHSTIATQSPDVYWNNPLFTNKRGEANPISGINPFYKYFDNYPNDPTVPVFDKEITWDNGFNSGNNEAYTIVKETNVQQDTFLLFANTAGRNYHANTFFERRSDAFQVDDEVSLSGIVPILNFPNYDIYSTPPASAPYILNGLYVKLISYNEADHSFQIQIKFDDYQVRDDKRWTGNIHVNNSSNNEQADVDLQSGHTICIDKSGTPNRHTKTEDNDFINLTEFHCNTDSKFLQQANSIVEVKNESSLIIHEGSTYEIMDGAKLTIKDNSVFEMEPCSKLIIHGSGELNFEVSSTMKIAEGAILVFDDINDNLSFDISKVEIPSGYINPYNILPKNYEISGTETWDEVDYYIYQDLIVEHGEVLNLINSDLKFGNEASPIVHPGGKLVIDGGTLTNSCGDMWQGITVLGNKNLSQYPTGNQGYVRVNKATIENAKTGIYSQNGGIVLSKNSNFTDNIIDIKIEDYKQGENNRSRIKNCEFTTTNNFYNYHFCASSHVYLSNTNRVNISGNIFANEASDSQPFSLRGRGILTLNSDVNIVSGCQILIEPYCPDAYKLPNIFNKLNYGIDIRGDNSYSAVNIDNNEFLECKTAIISSSNQAVITRNNITLVNPTNTNYPVGIYLANCTGYQVEENNISTSNSFTTNRTIGLVVRNSGEAPNEIYKNSFNNLYIACEALGNNGVRNSFKKGGLQFLCNNFENVGTSIYVSEYIPSSGDTIIIEDPTILKTKDWEYGIAEYQGSAKLPAQNTFINTERGIANYQAGIYYFYYPGTKPPKNTANVNLSQTFVSNDCPSHLSNGLPTEEELYRLKNSIATKQDYLQELTDAGETEETVYSIQTANPEDGNNLRKSLLKTSPTLSDTAMVSSVGIESVLPPVMLAQVLSANPRSAKSDKVLNALTQREHPLPPPFMDEILLGRDTLSEIEIETSNLGQYKSERSSLVNSFTHKLRTDTVSETATEELISFLSSENSLQTDYLLVAYYLHLLDVDNAELLLADIQNKYELSEKQYEEYNLITELTSIQADLIRKEKTYFEMDSLQKQAIYNIAQNNNLTVGVSAQNIISMVDSTEFYFGVVIPIFEETEQKHTEVQDNSILLFELSPKLATDYFIVDYNIPKKDFINAKFLMYNSNNEQVLVVSIDKKEYQLLIETEKYDAGVYTCKLFANNKMLSQKQVTIKGNEIMLNDELENQNSEIFTINPNPATDYLRVQYNQQSENVRNSKIRITDNTGKIVKEQSISNGQSEIIISDLPNGTYNISLKEDSKIINTQKIVINK